MKGIERICMIGRESMGCWKERVAARWGSGEDWFLEGGARGKSIGGGARKTGLSLPRGPQRSQVFQVASLGVEGEGLSS